VPGWWATTKIVLMGYSVLAILSVVLYAPFWLLGGISKRRRRPQERAMRWWALIAVLSLAGVVALIIVSAEDIIPRMGNLTIWSAGVFALTIFFAVASVLSIVAVWRADGARKWVKRYSAAVALALLITTVYFLLWGVIGLRTWA
jgi:hypothetical protein